MRLQMKPRLCKQCLNVAVSKQTGAYFTHPTTPTLTDRNHLQENVKKTIWTERSCVYFDETAIVESLIDKTAWFENSRMPSVEERGLLSRTAAGNRAYTFQSVFKTTRL